MKPGPCNISESENNYSLFERSAIMPTIKQLAANESKEKRFRGGHSLCRGCGIPIVVRTVLNSIESRVVVVNTTGCLEVATTRFPNTAWNVP